MKGAVCTMLFLVFAHNSFRVGGLTCYSCEGGPLSNCGKVVGIGVQEECSGAKPQCYEALVRYQSGALTLVQRRCWEPPEGTNDTFCQDFDNPNGRLGTCIACDTDLCNTDQGFWT